MAPKSYQIAHIYCLFFLMVVVCIANRDTDNTVKASKFNKDIYINLAKNEEYKEMKKCILVWQVPVIEGEPYNPVEYAVHVRKAKKFAEALNRYFAEKNMDYNCVLDKSACSLDEIFSPQYQAVLFAPTFAEYEQALEIVNCEVKHYELKEENGFCVEETLLDWITEKTDIVFLCNPNNPTGVIYSGDTLDQLQKALERAEARIGHPLYVISDEPYRELVYDDNQLPFMPAHVKNCLIVYSFSKSLSLPGERIGYLEIPSELEESQLVFDTASNANRIIGCVNAPSLQQKMIARCVDVKVDLDYYDKN